MQIDSVDRTNCSALSLVCDAGRRKQPLQVEGKVKCNWELEFCVRVR
jgi:hypothetical protein